MPKPGGLSKLGPPNLYPAGSVCRCEDAQGRAVPIDDGSGDCARCGKPLIAELTEVRYVDRG